jgi:hypothetical protein
MRRGVSPEKIAGACAMLCTDEAAFVTGQSIAVDGGSSLMNPDFPLPCRYQSDQVQPLAALFLRTAVAAMQVFPVAQCKSLHTSRAGGASFH